jgi:hypothetical protein
MPKAQTQDRLHSARRTKRRRRRIRRRKREIN